MVNAMKPTVTKLTVFGCIFLLQFLVVHSSSTTYSFSTSDMGDDGVEYRYTCGVGAPIVTGHAMGESYIDVNWFALVINGVLFYLLTLGLCWGYSKLPEGRRWLRIGAGATVSVMLMAFIGSVCISKYYWGYYFSRPAVLSEIWDVASVERITPVSTDWAENKPRSLQLRDDFSMAKRLADFEEDPYYNFDGRLLAALDMQGLLPETHSSDLDRLPPLLDLLDVSKLRVVPEAGYMYSDPYGGLVVEARGPHGESWLFLGLYGGQVSDDHYPYYELLFVVGNDAGEWDFIRGQQFFYDSAGWEGMEWYAIWWALSMLLVPLCWLAVCLCFLIWWFVRRRSNETSIDVGEADGQANEVSESPPGLNAR